MNFTPHRKNPDLKPWHASMIAGLLLGILWFSFYLQIQQPSHVNSMVEDAALNQDLLLSQPWRVVSASLLHVDLTHLMVNLILALTFGHTLTTMAGASWSWSIFFVSGWTGSIIAALTHNGWFIGASAGVFGLLGAIALSLGRIKKTGALRQALLVAGLSIFLGTVGIGNSTAHLGGFAAGAGLVIIPGRFHLSIQRLTLLSILMGLILMMVSRVG